MNFQSLNRCNTTTVVSRAITLTRPARIFAHAQGVYNENASGSKPIDVYVRLRQDGALVASTAQTRAFDTDQEEAVATGGVLRTSSSSTSVYTAPPGTYSLQFEVYAYGSCSGTPGATMAANDLSYVLLGTSN